MNELSQSTRPRAPGRRYLLMAMVSAAAMALVGWAIYLNLNQGAFLQQEGEARHLREAAISAHRGKILDRNGRPLAISAPVFSVWADPSAFVESGDDFATLAGLLEVTPAELRETIAARAGKEFLYLRRQVTPALAERVRALDIPGIGLLRENRRYYPLGEAASHVIGFAGVDEYGQEGIELAFEERLAGHPGAERVLRDNLGRIVERVGRLEAPRPGEDIVMPKGRYDIMRAYMPTKGKLGLDMMLRSCTVQVNLDFGSEADMIRKFRVALALQPVASALFANSPFTEGKPNGFLTFRSQIWTDTDPDRTGMLPFVFEDGFGFEAYADYALDVPMYFVYRDGKYIDASGQSFRDFLAGRLPALPGEIPSLKDWDDHMTTIFPEVRMKRFLEMRGADGGSWARLCALPALWVGLLYDTASRDAAWDLVKDWTAEDRQRLRDEVPKTALKTAAPGGGTLQDVAQEVLKIAAAGLQARARTDSSGNNETGFLNTLYEIADSGRTQAEELLDLYHGRWKGRVEPVFTEFHY